MVDEQRSAIPNSDGDGARPRAIKAILHGVDVLFALQRLGHISGVTELSKETGLSKGTVHAILRTLEARQLIKRTPAGQYMLGWRLFELGQAVIDRPSDIATAAAELENLAAETGETALLGILDEGDVLYVAIAESAHSVRLVAVPGKRSPVHATASGKVLLAGLDDSALAAYEKTSKSFNVRYNENTQTGLDVIREEVERVKRDGVAVCFEEYQLGEVSVSVPLHLDGRKYSAALTIAGPAGRLTRDAVQKNVVKLKETAARIAQKCGH